LRRRRSPLPGSRTSDSGHDSAQQQSSSLESTDGTTRGKNYFMCYIQSFLWWKFFWCVTQQSSSQMLVSVYQTTWCHILEDHNVL
jgi:hypothetical protein